MKESIFLSCIRSFFRSFFVILGIFFALIPIMFVLNAIIDRKDVSKKVEINILPDLKGETAAFSEKTPVILKINIEGIIGEKRLTSEIIENVLIESRKDTFKKDRVKGILLHINTPGGGVNDSDGIYRALSDYKKKYKIPIFAFVDGLCASGGFYISASCDKIYATPVSIIGSVGVMLGPFFNVYNALNKIGVESLTITEGKDKDMMNPLRRWREDESKDLQKLGSYFYNRFVSIVTQARDKITKEQLIEEYGAKVFDSMTAKNLGYIDNGDSDYKETLRELLKEAKIDEKKPYQIVEIQPKKRWISEIFNESIFIKRLFPYFTIKDSFLYLYLPRNNG
ncbi:MAG: hypothetical protein AMS24_04570 [Chlamydiae bacterium SM23_39]|nr:MAG: hypothetical protein AMS24_04570 [Chlamydiae bacterium SM23_39]